MESEFNRMADRSDIIESIAQMDNDRSSGYRGSFEPRDYHHNKVIRAFVEEQKKIAWLKTLETIEAQGLVEEQTHRETQRKLKQFDTTPNYDQLLAMYK